MRWYFFSSLFLATTLQTVSQTAATTPSPLPRDPRELLALAAPYYDFNNPTMRPWHLKASYQLYDQTGNPSEQGTYEYWWASPKIYRSTWTRKSTSHTDWHTADGKHSYEETGSGLSFFEYKLQSELFSPLPESSDLDPANTRLDREEFKVGKVNLPCVMVIPLMPQHGKLQTVPLGLFPSYCFDPNLPALRISSSFGTSSNYFNDLVKTQGHFLPREVTFNEGKLRILSAQVQTIELIPDTDPAFTPDTTATYPKVERVPLSAGVTVGMLLKKQPPVYPQDAKETGVSGRVVLQAIIGRDGKIHELKIVSTPWPSLAAAALTAVSQWEYRPYQMNGNPVEVETTINVIFTLGR
jgi:TonB family protein